MTEDENEEFVKGLIEAFSYPLSPEDMQVALEGYTCGFIPPEHRHLYHDPDWF